MKDYPSRKDIALGFDMFALIKCDDFRSDIAWCTTPEEKILINVSVSGQSEVNNNRLH